MKATKVLIGLILLAFFSSCEDVIDVDLSEGSKLLVVDAWINDSPGKQSIKLTTSAPYFTNASTPVVVGASVNMQDLNNGKVYVFNDAGNGQYEFIPTPSDTLGVIDHKYQLNINFNGYNYFSNSTLYKTTRIDSIIFRKGEEIGFGNNKGYFPYLVGIDIPNEKNFYWLKTYKNNVLFNKPQNMNISEDGGGGDGTDGLFFTPPVAFFTVTPSNDSFEENDSCKVEVISINRDSYNFLLQAFVQMTNSESGLFATTPENVRTNVRAVIASSPKAIGWFNIGSVKTTKAKVIP